MFCGVDGGFECSQSLRIQFRSRRCKYRFIFVELLYAACCVGEYLTAIVIFIYDRQLIIIINNLSLLDDPLLVVELVLDFGKLLVGDEFLEHVGVSHVAFDCGLDDIGDGYLVQRLFIGRFLD